MSQRRKDAVWAIVLAILGGLLLWHVISWSTNGMYLRLYQWLDTGKGYITVLYNLGLMLVTGVILTFLTGKVLVLLGYRATDETGSDNEDGDDNG